MITPLTIHTPAVVLARASVLNFRATARDRSGSTLGVLVDASGAKHHLTLISQGEDSAWALSNDLPAGREPVLLYESAANVLRGGTLDESGGISYQGASYAIEPSFDSGSRTAKVSGSR